MMPGTQFLTPTVHCPGCGELIDFHPEEWLLRSAAPFKQLQKEDES